MDDKLKQELEWLRYFYNNADDYIGPASCDVYDSLKENYVAEGGTLPEGYTLDDDNQFDEGEE